MRSSKPLKFNIIVFAVLLALGIAVVGCTSLYNTAGSRWNLADVYNPASSSLHPAYRVYHHSDNQSLLFIKLFPSELLFNQANPTGEFMSKVSVQLQTFEIDNNKPVLVDSITYTYNLKQENIGRRFLTQIPFKADTGKRYQLRVVARDLLRKDFNLRFIDVDKTSEFSQQNFNLLNQANIPYFNNVLVPSAIYRIEHRDKSYDTLFVHYFKDRAPVPSPTYTSVSDEILLKKADSIYILPYTPEMLLSFSTPGLYHFRFDTNRAEGLTIVNFGENFPKVKTAEEMLEPLVYLTNDAGYNNLLAEENKKLASDNFWLGIAETPGRARELIRVYYNRVYFANYYFSDSKPGWKTDRGMVYVVYGPPGNMEKTPNSETWIYYTSGASSTISFNFYYKPSPYSLDSYILSRSENHEWHWKEAIDTWRKGKIYLAN